MESILRGGDAAALPRSAEAFAGSSFGAGSALAARWRRIVARLAERLPATSPEPPPEWFRYPLP